MSLEANLPRTTTRRQASVIVWINGPFGAGKSTLAENLSNSLQAPIFDPEDVGITLRKSLPVPTGDFQDLLAWRRLVIEHIVSIAETLQLLIVPMSLSNEAYHAEIFSGLQERGLKVYEYLIKVHRAHLVKRVDRQDSFPDDQVRNNSVKEWRKRHYDHFQLNLGRLCRHATVLDGNLSEKQLLDAALSHIRETMHGSRTV